MKNINDSRGEVKILTLTGVLKQMIPTLMDDSEVFQDFSGESSCRCGGKSKRTGIRSEN